MTDDPLPLATTIQAAAEIVDAKLADPVGVSERADVLDALHRLDTATTPTHDRLAECLGLVDAAGRCEQCGRLVAWGMWRMQSHKDGGCLTAIPFVGAGLWMWQHKLSIPLVGQWLYRRRRIGDPSSNGHRPG